MVSLPLTPERWDAYAEGGGGVLKGWSDRQHSFDVFFLEFLETSIR